MGARGGATRTAPWTAALAILLLASSAHAQPSGVACSTPACKKCAATLKQKGQQDTSACASCQDPRRMGTSFAPQPALVKACYECVTSTPGEPSSCLTCGSLGATNATGVARCMTCLKTKAGGAGTAGVNACHCQVWNPPLDDGCTSCMSVDNTANRRFDCVACAQAVQSMNSSNYFAAKCFWCTVNPLRPADGDPLRPGRPRCVDCLTTFKTRNCLASDDKLVDGCLECVLSLTTELTASCFGCVAGRGGSGAVPSNMLKCLDCVRSPDTFGELETTCATCVGVRSAAEYGTCTACAQALGPGSAGRCKACFDLSTGSCRANPVTPDPASCATCIRRTNSLVTPDPDDASGDLYQLWCVQCSLAAAKDVRGACTDCLASVGSDAAPYCPECASAKNPKACLQCVRKAAALPTASARNGALTRCVPA